MPSPSDIIKLLKYGKEAKTLTSANQNMYPMRAYHASPHSFDRFDLSKVGTGEGNQTFGHGIYTAENPLVSGRGGKYDQLFFSKKSNKYPIEPYEEFTLKQMGKGMPDSDVLHTLTKQGVEPEFAQGILNKVNQNKSHIYDLGIKAPPDQFLRWDQPLRSNSPYVKERVDDLVKSLPKEVSARKFGEKTPYGEHMLGDKVYDYLAPRSEEATEKLLKAGIPGIRYLDSGSRKNNFYPYNISVDPEWGILTPRVSKEYNDLRFGSFEDAQRKAKELEASFNPTYNHVLFDPNLIDILKKYSIAGMSALPAMGSFKRSSSEDNSIDQ